jgi:lipopolysaccharide export system permease protein
MIVNRYLQRSVFVGTAAALLLLVSLAMFFSFVSELDNLKNQYGLLQVLQYMALRLPGRVVEFLPLAVLLGSMLSLGSLASNSELIAMQASGVTMRRMLTALLQAGLIIALTSFLLADWVVPDSEANARKMKNLNQGQATMLDSREGIWIKDETRVLRIQELLPNGFARGIEIYQLDERGDLQAMIRAGSAEALNGGWELFDVRQTTIVAGQSRSQIFERLVYPGNLSHELLQVLLIEPRQMSSRDLFAYLQFLDENRLDDDVERLIFWQKMFSPVTIVIMCLLAFPFVIGSQRQSNTGKRLLIGILLGLAFVVVERVLTQLGMQYGMDALLVAFAPNLLLLLLALYLLFGRQSGVAGLRRLVVFSRT